eukprot:TRINITY_DN5964_c0_g1_i1.p2 TRINITY_DN5964_c0_g1~~TRINITY_DN5964_c0_g1_i1.p2  ORF type:complete len:295 (+),score=54.55 TRINITY_DN5964_c0_g1_i1:126-1010(+)
MELPELSEIPKLGGERIKELLRGLRMKPQRKSEFVVRCGDRLLHENVSMGSEKWMILEQIAIACMDCARLDTADYCIKMLAGKFGNGNRVLRLSAMLLEAKGSYDEAKSIYDKILESTPNDKACCFRKAAILKAQGKYEEAIKVIEEHLELGNTQEGYIEIVVLSLSSRNPDFSKAMFATEELLLQDPTNFFWFNLYAELLFSSSSAKPDLLTSRRYYSQSIAVNDAVNNTRAVWGLLNCCRTLEKSHQLSPTEQTENAALSSWAISRLQATYTNSKISGPQAKIALSTLATYQ